MATFEFAAGNARKVLRIPLYALGAAASLVVPRDRRLWVIGSGVGFGEGAVPFARLAAEHSPDRRIVWLASTEAELAEAREAGFDAELKTGWGGFRRTVRARVLVVTHGFGDVNRYGIRGGFVVQLWHGIPLKKLHLDSPAALRISFLPNHRLVRGVMSRAYRAAGRQISLFPVASELVRARIVSAFGVPSERVVATGDIRDDALLRGTPETRRAEARALIETAVDELPQGDVLLYAPTWRDGAPDPGAPDAAQWREIADWLEARTATLLIRSHPLGLGDYADGPRVSDRIRMLGSDRMVDVTPALPAIDTLITDYSSIAFDHALSGGRTVFFAPDLEAYAKSRGMYQAYREFSGGRHATDWPGVLSRLDEPLSETAEHTAWLADEFVDRRDGRATERVLAEVLRRIGEPVPPMPGLDTPPIPRPLVRSIGFDPHGPSLDISLEGAPAGVRVVLDGGRAIAEGVARTEGSLLHIRIPLLETRWGDPGLALPSGHYRLMLIADGAEPSSRLAVPAALGTELLHTAFRATASPHAGGLRVVIEPPFDDDERGASAQRALQDTYFRAVVPATDSVFFESFYGRSASCNPLGIDRALARMRPDVVRYWSVVDASVPVPDGAVRIIEGSREWWRARASARVLVVNDWLRKRWKRRPHQKVVQTWHGTMLKRLAIDRPGIGFRTRIAVLRERDRWDYMLAQNDYAAKIFRTAYAFRGPIWEEGYPRNDELASDDGTIAARVRERIGISPGVRVVLYAPTWRDDRTEMVDYLDLENFASELDDDTVLLVRGHSRTLPFGRTLHGDRLLDVTGYPSMSELLLVADTLVTDYSSVMFDFAATGRPIILFTPDLAHYSEDLRGFYFDLLAEAPGPVVSTRDALIGALHDPESTAAFAERRAMWRERFAPNDDGHASERVVQRMLDEGLLP